MNHLDRIQLAIDLIESKLDEELSNSSVSSYVGFSEYHFHRIFSAVVGESVSQYVRNRRMAKAVLDWRTTSGSILDIALDAGFDTQESFSRAFKKIYGITPGQCRKGTPVKFRHEPFNINMQDQHKRGAFMEPTFVNREGEYAIGLGSSFPPNSFKAIGELWQKFQARQHEIKNVKNGYALGICMQEHAQISRSSDDCFIYVAALPVASVEDVPEGMVVCKLETARYARFTHSGPLSKLPETVNYIWGTWLPESRIKQANGPDFELYDERFDPRSLDGEFDIYLPTATE